ncbi:MAG TPA: VCBS repeat-containing protein, partial [Candidatus Thermoplasmatota archaeon]|nr:VCBS repeat-containing protein [Candidatus Thermoplasmatota archaeon]
ITPASVPVSPAIGELDGEWPREVLYIARYAPREHEDPADYLQYHMAVFALRQDPQTYQVEVVWMRQPEWANPLSNTQLIVQDVDGDGRGDVFGMDWNTIGHRPGNWEVLGPAHVFRLDWRGNDVWVRELEAYWSNQAIALTDATGDGKLDVLANAPGPGGDGLWALDIENGRSKRFVHAPGWKLLRGPHLTDLHGDGKLYIAYPGQPEPDVPRGAIILFDMGVPYARDSMESAWQG